MTDFRITIGITGTAPEKLKAAQRKLRPALRQGMIELMNDIWRRAQQKVSGPVLRVRSGHLRRSMGPPTVTLTETGAVGALGVRAVYGAIHEFGGTIPAHDIVPRFRKALRFPARQLGGRSRDGFIFAKRVHMPAITMPARPYLRPSFEEVIAGPPRASERLAAILIQSFTEA
jgi:phage gpG-like protein